MTGDQRITTAFSVDQAVAIARQAHQGQFDKAGQPYIHHPLRVMENVNGEPQTDHRRRVAANPLALTVKRADIADNSNPERLAQLEPSVRARLIAKYAQARRLLDKDELEPTRMLRST